MIEVVIEVVFEAVLPFIGRVLGYIFIELLLHIICYTTGFAITRLFTFGKRPELFISPSSSEKQDNGLILIGLLFWCVVLFGGAFALWS